MTAANDGAPLALAGLAIDRAGEIPIGLQLAWALRARIGEGQLPPGQRLPGVRELAEAVGINANTARAVYQRLEREGLIESRHGTGTFVADAARGRSHAGELAAEVARQARDRGMDPRDVAAALYVARDEPVQPSTAVDPSGEGAERRRRLREQIVALEQALAEIETANPGLLGPARDAPRMAGPRLLSAEELEQVRARLVRRLGEAQTALDSRNPLAREESQPAVQGPVPTGRRAPAKTLATVKLATP